MSASIISRTISSVVDKRVSLGNDQIIRTMLIGSTWTRLRIGMRLSINLNALTTSGSGVIFQVGLCSGTTAGIGAATTTNFIGFKTGTTATGGATLQYTANSGAPYVGNSTGSIVTKKVATTVTAGTATSTSWPGFLSSTTNDKRLAYVFEFLKGSPNWTLQLINTTNVSVIATDITSAGLLSAMEAADMTAATAALNSVVTGHAAITAITQAFDETAGSIDSINILWGSAVRTLEISEVLYARIA